jgi:hypothetical protein
MSPPRARPKPELSQQYLSEYIPEVKVRRYAPEQTSGQQICGKTANFAMTFRRKEFETLRLRPRKRHVGYVRLSGYLETSPI